MSVDKEELLRDLHEYQKEVRYLEMRSRRRELLMRTFLLTATALTTALAVYLQVISSQDKTPTTTTPPKSESKELEQEVGKLKQQLYVLNLSVQNSGNKDVSVLSGQVDSLERKLNDLSATILEDPDKALTARLLREKQLTLQAEVKDLKADNAALRQSVMDGVITIIAVPLAAGLITVAIDYVGRRKEKPSRNKVA